MEPKIIKLSFIGAFLSLSNCVNATSFTQQNVAKALGIINLTFEAFGGAEKLEQLDSVILDFDQVRPKIGQSKKPNPPWDTVSESQHDTFNFEKLVYYSHKKTDNSDAFSDVGLTADDKSSSFINHQLRTRTSIPNATFDDIAGTQIRQISTLLLKRLQSYTDSARYLGEHSFNGKAHDLINFTIPGTPSITLYIDQKNHMVSKSERMSGTRLIEYFYKDYKKVDGIYFPFNKTTTSNGELIVEDNITSYQVNKVDDDKLQMHADYHQIAAKEIKTTKMGEGVYWVTDGGQNSLFVEFEDRLMMIGGFFGVTQRIAEIQKTLPNKQVKQMVITHHHSDHIAGSKEAQKSNISIVALKDHQQVIRETMGEKEQSKVMFETVVNKRVFEDMSQKLVLIDIGPTPHSDHHLLAYLPKQGIIFEADHFVVPAMGPMPVSTPNIEHLVNSIKKHNLNVLQIAPAHGDRSVSYQQLMESYNKKI